MSDINEALNKSGKIDIVKGTTPPAGGTNTIDDSTKSLNGILDKNPNNTSKIKD